LLYQKLTVRAVNHDGQLLTLLGESLLGSLNAGLVVVGALGTTSKNDETVLVAGGAGNGGKALLGNTHEVMFGSSSTDSVNSDTQAAVGAVLETNRERKARSKLAVKLALSCAGANGTNRDQVGKKLRGDGVEHLGGNGHAGRGEVAKQLSGDTETLVDLESLVDVRVVDEALPADSRPGLLEVGAHDDDKVI